MNGGNIPIGLAIFDISKNPPSLKLERGRQDQPARIQSPI
jgi:hypothetical protein